MHSKDLSLGLIEVAETVLIEIVRGLSSPLTWSSTSEKPSPNY